MGESKAIGLSAVQTPGIRATVIHAKCLRVSLKMEEDLENGFCNYPNGAVKKRVGGKSKHPFIGSPPDPGDPKGLPILYFEYVKHLENGWSMILTNDPSVRDTVYKNTALGNVHTSFPTGWRITCDSSSIKGTGPVIREFHDRMNLSVHVIIEKMDTLYTLNDFDSCGSKLAVKMHLTPEKSSIVTFSKRDLLAGK